MKDWIWLSEEVVRAIHEAQIAEHGGPTGIGDPGALASALARPKHRAAYGRPDTAELAAAYAFGLARNHPFVDGNKRVTLVAAELFVELNGGTVETDDAEWVVAMLDLAAGHADEDSFAQWLRERMRGHGT